MFVLSETRVTKTMALISCEVTAQLFCTFVFAKAKIQFSHDVAHIMLMFVFSHEVGEIKLVLFIALTLTEQVCLDHGKVQQIASNVSSKASN